VTRAGLTSEAIRVGRLLCELLPEPEVVGLLALMLLQESRRGARTSPEGELILLDDQDRSSWNREQIAEGVALVERALATRRFGAYTLQAAIAALHAEAKTAGETDWEQIVALYNALLRIEPTPVIELNRAAALAMRDGPHAGLRAIDAILENGELANYHFAHAARAELHRRLGNTAAAREAYERALELARQETGAAIHRETPPRARLKIFFEAVSKSAKSIDYMAEGETTMKYICMGYIEPHKFEKMSTEEQHAMLDSCIRYDDVLRANGNFAEGFALGDAVALRWSGGKVAVTDGPFAETKEQIGGIMILEARDLNHAIELISKHPGVEYGPWETRPLVDISGMIAESEQRRGKVQSS
jgi:hypothetical protein